MGLEEQQKLWQDTTFSEVARIFFGNPYLIDSMGGLLPSGISLKEASFVLDIGCGSGEWTRRLAREYPHVHIVGIDTSHVLIREAVDKALREDLSSVSYVQFDAAQPLAFSTNKCDVIHVQSLASFLVTPMRDKIIEDMIRILKPGGWLNIIDYEQGSTSSAAFNRLSVMGLKGVGALGGSFAPTSSTYGVAARLYGFLVEAGMIDVSYSLHTVDYGLNSHIETAQFLDDLVVGMKNFKPLVLYLGLIDSETFDQLVEQAKEELHQPDTCGYAYLISAVGRKDPI